MNIADENVNQTEKEAKMGREEKRNIERKYESFTEEDAGRLAKEGEKLAGKGFVKTDGFEKTVALLMMVTKTVWEIMRENKSFRMELFYDEETLNTNYCFFTPINQCASDGTRQEC